MPLFQGHSQGLTPFSNDSMMFAVTVSKTDLAMMSPLNTRHPRVEIDCMSIDKNIIGIVSLNVKNIFFIYINFLFIYCDPLSRSLMHKQPML